MNILILSLLPEALLGLAHSSEENSPWDPWWPWKSEGFYCHHPSLYKGNGK